MADPFATSADLEARWRTLSGAERVQADILLGDASAILRALSKDMDSRISSGDLDPDLPKAVVCSMVKRSMQSPDLDGVTQETESKGPFSHSFTFANPAGDLYLTKAEKKLLGISGQRAFMIDLIADDSSSSSSSSS